MRTFVLATVLLAVPGAALADVDLTISHWNENHPEAASTLGDWVRQYPQAAHRLFQWNRHHPLRSRAFIRWMSERPQETLDDFLAAHKDWRASQTLLKRRRDAVESLIAWARAHTDATREIAVDEQGFSWLGFHLFGPLWDPGHTNAQAHAVTP